MKLLLILEHFRGTEALPMGHTEAIAFVASVKYQSFIYDGCFLTV